MGQFYFSVYLPGGSIFRRQKHPLHKYVYVINNPVNMMDYSGYYIYMMVGMICTIITAVLWVFARQNEMMRKVAIGATIVTSIVNVFGFYSVYSGIKNKSGIEGIDPRKKAGEWLINEYENQCPVRTGTTIDNLKSCIMEADDFLNLDERREKAQVSVDEMAQILYDNAKKANK